MLANPNLLQKKKKKACSIFLHMILKRYWLHLILEITSKTNYAYER